MSSLRLSASTGAVVAAACLITTASAFSPSSLSTATTAAAAFGTSCQIQRISPFPNLNSAASTPCMHFASSSMDDKVGRTHKHSRGGVGPLFLSDRTAELERAAEEAASLSSLSLQSTTTTITASNAAAIQTEAEAAESEYKRGLLTIGFITLIFSSMSPAMHAALSDTTNTPPPVLLLNAAVSVVALCGLLFAGPLLEASTPLPRSLVANQERMEQKDAGGAGAEAEEGDPGIGGSETKSLSTSASAAASSSSSAALASPSSPEGSARFADLLPLPLQAGLELGLWKFLGTTANLYGLSLTTSDHGAFLIQLTTLIVPTVQGLMGVPIPSRIKGSIGLALCGVWLFTQDPAAGTSAAAASDAVDVVERTSNLAFGDALCVVAAGFYATYDLRLFKWGKLVKPRELITGKIMTQALLSVLLLLAVGYNEAVEFIQHATLDNAGTITLLALWSGLAVNAVAPFLQVGGQQAVGPTRAQTLYASQPLWAAILSYVFLGETVGTQGVVGGAAFLTALFLAATAEPPDADCGVQNCEV